jgi:UDP-N-acetylmuramate dehydrogenase
VRWVTLLLPDGTMHKVDVDALEYGYRASALKREPDPARRPIVLEVAMQLSPGDPSLLASRARRVGDQRRLRTPKGCSAGSIFKRTLQYPAGFLIDQAGLKGTRIGDAEVSAKHANFLMNTGSATAEDMRALIHKVQREVWAVFAQRLEPEIEFLGEWCAEPESQAVAAAMQSGES